MNVPGKTAILLALWCDGAASAASPVRGSSGNATGLILGHLLSKREIAERRDRYSGYYPLAERQDQSRTYYSSLPATPFVP